MTVALKSRCKYGEARCLHRHVYVKFIMKCLTCPILFRQRCVAPRKKFCEYRHLAEMRREAKKEVAKAKNNSYDELYEGLDSKEGERTLYRLARQRHQAGKDVQQVRMMKDTDGKVMTDEESVLRIYGRNTTRD